MYKRVGPTERSNIVNKLKFMLAIKMLEQNESNNDICKKQVEYIKFMMSNKDEFYLYINTIESLKNDLLSPIEISLDTEHIDTTIEMLVEVHDFESYSVLNSTMLVNNPLDLDINEFLFDLNALYNMEIAKSKVRCPEKIKWDAMKIDTISLPSMIDYQPDITDTDVEAYIQNILECMGYNPDIFTLMEAESCSEYNLECSFYYQEVGGMNEYKISLPLPPMASISEEDMKYLDEMGFEIFTNNCDESIHQESFISSKGDLIMLCSENDFINRTFINRLVNLFEFCEELSKKYNNKVA